MLYRKIHIIITALLLICFINATAQDESAASPLKVRQNATGNIIIGEGPAVRIVSPFHGTTEARRNYANVVNRYAELFPNVQIYCMCIPIAVEYYLPNEYKDWSQPQDPAINELNSMLNDCVVGLNLYWTLHEHKDEPIYSRTDHHWAPLGAYYAAQDFALTAQVAFEDLSHYRPDTVHHFVGTMPMFAKEPSLKQYSEDFVYYVPQDAEYTTTAVSYTLDKARKNIISQTTRREVPFFRQYPDGSGAAYCTFFGGDSNNTQVKTSTGNGRNLLIFKDSFGNALPGYLFYSFEEIHIVDCRYFAGSIQKYIGENGITDILFANNITFVHMPNIVDNYNRYLIQK